MKTIGLIGGMSWESSIVYYELINKRVNELLGGFHSCKSIMFSVDFASIEKLQAKYEKEEVKIQRKEEKEKAKEKEKEAKRQEKDRQDRKSVV